MQAPARSTAFRQALGVLRHHLWVVVACVVVVPVVAFAVSKSQSERFEGSASVLVSFKDAASAAGADADRIFNHDDAQRFAATQATIARSPSLARRVVRRLKLREDAAAFLSRSTVVAQPNTDLLVFSVQAGSATGARRAATAYAHGFVTFRSQLEREVVRRSIADPARRRQALAALTRRPTGRAYYVAAAADTPKVAPSTKRNVALGLALGILLAFSLAFGLEAIDTRVRRGKEIADALGLPVLGRLPRPARRRGDLPVVLEAPDTTDAEGVRMLRAGYTLATRDGSARCVLVCSAQPGEGKTTTVAELAAALALAGRHVVAVDLDLRNPGLGAALGAPRHGLTDVIGGRVELDEALHSVSLRESPSPELSGGRLEVLGAGTATSDPGELVGTEAVAGLLTQLRERADVVLVDSPPLLRVGDALQLSSRVDALLVVARVGSIKRNDVTELQALLGAASVPALGVVLTAADTEDKTGPAYGYYLLQDEPWARTEPGRGTAASPRS